MVNDKYQVRSTGPVNASTVQPVKGSRKRGGGIVTGEWKEMHLSVMVLHSCCKIDY